MSDCPVEAMFALVDADKSGELEAKEIVNFIGMGDADDPDVKEFTDSADANKDGKVSVEELKTFFKKKEETLGEGYAAYLEQCQNMAKASSRMQDE